MQSNVKFACGPENSRKNTFLGGLLPIIASTAISVLAFTFTAPASAEDRIDVVLDQAKVLEIPPNASTIILGNPMIADVTMINSNKQLIVTGKAYGQTNMIALDKKGKFVSDTIVVVKPPQHGLLVQRGMIQETYSCEPNCQPTVRLGDNHAYSAQQITAAKAYEGASTAARK